VLAGFDKHVEFLVFYLVAPSRVFLQNKFTRGLRCKTTQKPVAANEGQGFVRHKKRAAHRLNGSAQFGVACQLLVQLTT
jgi:hypothetical protein